MIPSKAMLKLSRIEGGRRPGAGLTCRTGARISRSRALHLVAVPVPSRCRIPCTSGHRHSSPTTCGQMTTSPSARGTPPGSSSRPSIGNESTSVASSTPRCSALSARISSAVDERDPELCCVDALGGERVAREGDRTGGVHLDAAPVRDLDLDHF